MAPEDATAADAPTDGSLAGTGARADERGGERSDGGERDEGGANDSAAAGDSGVADESGDRSDARDVEVPMRVYKTVTVFSTLFAVIFVLAGFLLLDRATERATAAFSEVDPVLAVLGLLSIVAGAAVYAYGTRFRAEGMGKPKDRSDEGSNDE